MNYYNYFKKFFFIALLMLTTLQVTCKDYTSVAWKWAIGLGTSWIAYNYFGPVRRGIVDAYFSQYSELNKQEKALEENIETLDDFILKIFHVALDLRGIIINRPKWDNDKLMTHVVREKLSPLIVEIEKSNTMTDSRPVQKDNLDQKLQDSVRELREKLDDYKTAVEEVRDNDYWFFKSFRYKISNYFQTSYNHFMNNFDTKITTVLNFLDPQENLSIGDSFREYEASKCLASYDVLKSLYDRAYARKKLYLDKLDDVKIAKTVSELNRNSFIYNNVQDTIGLLQQV